MSRKEWTLVILVIGLGIVWQIPGHDEAVTEPGEGPHAHSVPAASSAEPGTVLRPTADPVEEGPYQTIVLEVSGMT